MRVDIVSIFPEYFSVLEMSLLGKASARGLIQVHVHDLRDATHDRHRTVDDTPAGGGAGMVMKPEPWGEAFDRILTQTDAHDDPLIVLPSPAGERFSQTIAAELATENHLIFGCGRYEGIDQRVEDEYASRGRVRLLSLGDYVLNGGEVAALAMIEAFARLIPGVIGNPESLVEESHEDGLLEGPSYTKPAEWRGWRIPEILLSGNHQAIAQWRAEQRLERTRRVRPDLLDDEALQ